MGTRDVNGDGTEDVVVHARRGRKKLVKVFSGLDGSALPAGLA